MSRTPVYDPDREAYEKGTLVVACLLGATALVVLLAAPALASAIDRAYTPTSELVTLAIASLAASIISTLVPGIWRLVALALATAPLLAVVAAYSNSA